MWRRTRQMLRVMVAMTTTSATAKTTMATMRGVEMVDVESAVGVLLGAVEVKTGAMMFECGLEVRLRLKTSCSIRRGEDASGTETRAKGTKLQMCGPDIQLEAG